MTARRAAVALAILAAAVWSLGFLRFVDSMPRAGPVPAARADAIVALTGGSGRLAAGTRLLAAGRADVLFVSGVNPEVERRELRALAAREGATIPDALFACCLEVGYRAEDTLGNAAETAAWARRRGARSILLVTSNYHMPRSLLEATHAMPDIAIHPHPVFADAVKLDSWWLWPGSLRLLWTEYHKYLLAGARALAG